MAKRVQLIRHNQAAADAFTGLQGEVTIDTTNKELRVHDSLTVGGLGTARKDLANVADATASNAGKMTALQVTQLAQALLDIAANTTNISNNDTDIATNVANIATNTADILLRELSANKGAANGYPALDASSKVVQTALLADSLVSLVASVAELNHMQGVASQPVEKSVTQQFTKLQNYAVDVVTLPVATNIDWDWTANPIKRVTLQDDAVLNNPTNMKAGCAVYIILNNDGVGGHALTFGTKFRTPFGSTITMPADPNSYLILSCIYDATDDVVFTNAGEDYS